MKDHLSYYDKIKETPTLDIDNNKNLLFRQRFAFYFSLKISENDFDNKTVLEMCPGSGYNAYYLLKKCKIKNIELIDYSDDSIKKLNKNLSNFKNVIIKKKNIRSYNTKKKYDFVIMENALDGFDNDQIIFKKLCKFTKRGGNIIFNFGDLFGIFSTKIKFLHSKLILDQRNISNFDKKLIFLSNFFANHLLYLSKNTRSVEKWVLDNILNEEWIKKENYFDYDKLLKLINSNYLIKSNSPIFQKKFTWYKNKKLSSHNLDIFEEYKKNKLNLLDFETKFKSNLDTKNLERHIKRLYGLISKIETDKKIELKNLNSIQKELEKISEILNRNKFNNKISLALNESISAIIKFKKNKKIQLDTKYLNKFWGIYTQNCCIIKIK
jgi:hypothetical protein